MVIKLLYYRFVPDQVESEAVIQPPITCLLCVWPRITLTLIRLHLAQGSFVINF